MDIVNKVIKELIDRKLTIATMESCTGGFLTHLMTNIPGSSEVVIGGYVTYTTKQKINCGVDEEIITKYGVYSLECSKSMAEAVFKNTSADICLGITGKVGYGEGRVDVTYLFLDNKQQKELSKHYELPENDKVSERRINKKEYIAKVIFNQIVNELQTIGKSKIERGD